MGETLNLPARQILTVTGAPTATGAVVRLGDRPGEPRIATYALPAGGVLAFGYYSAPTWWAISREVGDGEPSYSVQAPEFAPVAVVASELSGLDHSTANAGFAYLTPAGCVRWNPAAQAWQNVAGAPGAPVSIHAPTVISRADVPAFESGVTAALDGGGTGDAGLFWLNVPTAFSFAWLLDGEVIPGATEAKYEIQAGDVGGELACRVTATNSHGSATVTTAAVTVA